MKPEDVFYMVYCPERGKPTAQHSGFTDARDEAERICRKENKRVWVLVSNSYVEPSEMPVKWTI
jgi:hypothetical protein